MRRLLILLAAIVAAPGASALAASLPPQPSGVTAAASPEQVARAVVQQRPGLVDGATSDELVVTSTEPGLADTTVVRLQQELGGVPVLGGEVVVVVDDRNRVVAADGAVLDGATPPLSPTITADAARRIATRALAKGLGTGLVASDPSLVAYDPDTMNGAGPPRATAAWDVDVRRGGAVHQRVFVDARTGTVIQAINLVQTAKDIAVCNAGSANARVPCAAPFARVNSGTASGNAEVDAAYDLTGATYDFFATFGRDSINGSGMRILSTVNFCETTCPYLNAFWDGSQMVFGPGFASADDVVAHELTHGVTERTSGLVYWYQSGAINEALSDIMGELFDLQRNPTPANPWKIAEDSPLGVIRDMANPPANGDPDRMTSPNYVSGIADSGGVHTNSGVANKAAYLISDGGTFNGQTITAIGRTKSMWLWYQTGLTLRMSSDYADLADALEQTCATLAGAAQAGMTAADCVQVGKAITATEMRTSPLAVPAVCPAGATALDAFQDGFDTGIATNWSTAATIGTNQWLASSAASPDGAPMTWPTATSTNARGVDSALPTDSTMTMRTGVTIPSGAYLRLRHWHQFEASMNNSFVYQGYDGGVIEYSTNNGASWTDIAALPAVNGYTGVINQDLVSDNSLEGRQGFIAASNGAVTTRLDLSSLAGQTVKFRFRVATDTGTSGYGWYIDEVRINNCVTAPGAPTVTGITPTDGGLSVAFTQGATGGATPTNIEYSTNDGASWTTRSPASITSPLVITGLTNGTAYPVRIRVVGPGGTGTQSNAITETPNGPVARTIAITSTQAASYPFTATPPTIAATPSHVGGAITYASSTSGVCTVGAATGVVAFVTTGTCSITAAVALSGNLQPATSSATTFQIVVAPPGAPTVTGITPATGSMSVAFTLGATGGATPTNIEYSTNDGASWTTRSPASITSPLVITGLTDGDTYPVRLRVVGPGGTGAQSNAVTESPNGPVTRTIAITSAQAATYTLTDTPPTIVATPSRAGGAITFTSSTPSVCTVGSATGTVVLVAPGTCSITAAVALSANLQPATSSATTFQVTAPPIVSAPAPTPTPAIETPAAAPAEVPAASTPATSASTPVTRWVAPTTSAPTTTTFPAQPGTTYTVRAVRRGAPKTAAASRGSCKVTGAQAKCSIRLATAGTWEIVTTPIRNGKAGTPARTVVRVKRGARSNDVVRALFP